MLFTSNPAKVSVAMNSMSALASAFAILFLFWTITHLARKIILVKRGRLYLAGILAVMGAGVVGALAYTFSDTFWFSAVEAEVYGTSSLFTAFVFWAILKWENVADEPRGQQMDHPDCLPDGAISGGSPAEPVGHSGYRFRILFQEIQADTGGIIISLLISVGMLGL